MKTIIFICGTLLFARLVLTSSMNNRLSGELTRRHTTIEDLNDDCKLLILEQLDFSDLFTMAEVSPSFSMAAVDVYNRTLSNLPIILYTPDRKIKYPEKNMIEIGKFEKIKSVLIHFGHVISKLKFYGTADSKNETQTKIISNLISLHCSATLKELTLSIGRYGTELLDNLAKPFEKVEHFSIRGDYQSLGNKHLSLNELFPVMKKLSLYAEVVESDGIDAHFPNLRDFSVINRPKTNRRSFLDDDDIERFIRKNPQIQNISLTCDTTDFLWFISEHLPQLTKLSTSGFDGDAEDQRVFPLQNVRSFKVEHLEGPLPNGFRNLEVLKLRYSEDLDKSLKDLLRNNTHLKHFDAYGSDSFDEDELNELTQLIPNLETLWIEIRDEVSDDCIINFLKASKMLKKVRFSREIDFEETAARLQAEIGHEWHIVINRTSWVALVLTSILM